MLDTYILDIDRPLPADLVFRLGLDSGGRDGNARFPYTWAKLTVDERRRLRQAVADASVAATPIGDRAHPLAMPVRGLTKLLEEVDEAWNAEINGVPDGDDRDALMAALSEGFPFGAPLEDLVVAVRSWEDHVFAVLRNPPTVLSLAARELTGDAAAVLDDLRQRMEPNDLSNDDNYRQLFNGLLGGRFGRVGGTFTPTVLSRLATLLQAIHDSRDQQVRDAGMAFAREMVASRKKSIDF
jgi:hypothetical protein